MRTTNNILRIPVYVVPDVNCGGDEHTEQYHFAAAAAAVFTSTVAAAPATVSVPAASTDVAGCSYQRCRDIEIDRFLSTRVDG